VNVTLTDASWVVVGQMVAVQTAAGADAGSLKCTAKAGNQITLLNTGGGMIPVADATQDGLLRRVSGVATDYVDGTNNSQRTGPVILGGPAGTESPPSGIWVPRYSNHPDAVWAYNAFDDHFDAGTLDPKWTQFITAGSGGPVIDMAGSELTLASASPNSTNGAIYVVSATQALLNQTAPFQITAKMATSLFAYNAAASLVWASLRLYSPSNYGVDFRVAASYAPGPPIISYIYCQVMAGLNMGTSVLLLYGRLPTAYIRFVYGTDRSVIIWASNNGKSWFALISVAAATSGFATEIPTRAGLYMAPTNSARGLLSCDWIRFQNN
jgi:hypothetical protein